MADQTQEIVADTLRPMELIGLIVFSPASVMKSHDVVVAYATAPAVIATGFALGKHRVSACLRRVHRQPHLGNLAHGGGSNGSRWRVAFFTVREVTVEPDEYNCWESTLNGSAGLDPVSGLGYAMAGNNSSVGRCAVAQFKCTEVLR